MDKSIQATAIGYGNSPKLIRNNKIFTVIFAVLEVIFLFMYGFYVRPQAYPTLELGVSGLFMSTSIALLVLIGFGLFFSYMRHLAWSGIGFTLLVTMITFQYYFLINGFWTKANLQFSKTWFTLPDKSISIFLSEEFGSSLATYGNTAAGAFKCALSMVVAFAAISGRGGPLEAIVMIIFGVVLYEVNRQLIGLFSTDVGGSMSIFLFGGMYGSAVSFILSICRQKSPIQSHIHFQSSRANVAWALVGASFCWVLFPVLNMDVPIINFNGTIGGISTVYCISSTVVTSVAMSLIMHGQLHFRDLISAPIVGGVVVGSGSVLMSNPLQGIILGVLAGSMLVLLNWVYAHYNNLIPVSNNVFFTFVVFGFIGGLSSAAFRAISLSNPPYTDEYTNLASPYNVMDPRGQVSATFISLGIGLLTGLVVGAILLTFNSEEANDYFHDNAYWNFYTNGLNKPTATPQFKETPKTQAPPVESNQEIQIEFGSQIKGSHAEL